MHHIQHSINIKNKYLIATIAVLTAPLSGFAIDVYVPSLPEVSRYFHVMPSLSQLTISMYLLGFALIQLFIGSISDAIGRKKISVFGFVFFIILCLCITQTNSIVLLIFLRCLQGVAMGCTLTGTRASIADLFSGKEFHKINSYLMLFWAIGPIIAPAIGGYLQHLFNWHASFYFLMLYAILIFIPYLIFVPETIKQKKSFNVNHLFSSYKLILTDVTYWAGAISCGCVYAIFMLFNMIAPFVIQGTFHYSVVEFGHIALFMGLSWFVGNLINRIFIRTNYMHRIKIALWVMLITVIIAVIVSFNSFSVIIIVIPTAILLICGGLIFPNYISANVTLFPTLAATAGALTGSVILIITALVGSGLGGVLKSNTSLLPINLGFALLILVSVIAYKVYMKTIKMAN